MSGRIKRYSKGGGISFALIVQGFEYSIMGKDILNGFGESCVFIVTGSRELRRRYLVGTGKTSSEFDDEG